MWKETNETGGLENKTNKRKRARTPSDEEDEFDSQKEDIDADMS